nr:DUF3488 and transglutaminase-like domain-containing protein [Phytoactinopolyspora mesophila]
MDGHRRSTPRIGLHGVGAAGPRAHTRRCSVNSRTRPTVVGGIAALVSIVPLLELTVDASWVAQAVLAVVIVVAIGYTGRYFRVPAVLTLLAQILALTWWIGLLIAADLAWFGVFPSTTWPARFIDVFTQGAESISVLSTPVPITDGILVYLVAGAGGIAIFVDLLAAALRRSVLAGVPLAAAYTVTASIEGGDIGWWWFVPPAAGFMALLVVESRARVSAWGHPTDPHRNASGLPATNALARNGRRVGVVALSAAIAVPAFAPVLTDGLVDGRGGGGGGSGDGRTIRTDNPILDLQRNLTRPDNVDVLRYAASDEAPHYIRTVTLDAFDGEVWKTSDRPVPESQRVADGMPEPPGLDLDDPAEVEFEFAITDNYSSRWLPLAYPAQQIEIAGDWRYDVTTLDVVSTDEDVLGADYTAVSLDITIEAEQLQEARSPNPDVEELTELPEELPAIVTDLADEVTQDAEDDFAKAAALQQWFRGPAFTYDLSTQPGTSSSALADFLEDRRGYCEQFAATMAIMARYLDIPARVAVGFTPGTFEGGGTWLVRAHDAHAWPELYFEGAGWVRFEPTPASRTGTAPSWTIEPSPDTPDDQPDEPDATSTADSRDNLDQLPEDDLLGGGGGATPTDSSPWPQAVALALLGAFVLGSTPSAIARLRRWRRWQRAGQDTTAAAAAAWSEVSEAVRDAGYSWNPAATPRVAGRTIATSTGISGEMRTLLDHLVSVVERARYARSAEPVPELRTDTALFCRSLLRSQPVHRRARAFLWPATLTDAWTNAAQKVSAALDWLDDAGPRLRASLARSRR